MKQLTVVHSTQRISCKSTAPDFYLCIYSIIFALQLKILLTNVFYCSDTESVSEEMVEILRNLNEMK